ncbi:glycosyltransferase family 2 protein [Mediterraneibacter agrestimuris]|uniref:glycosyltransferase family 2 protein n=1 Tax=Mediterraneibacter agrestimuris TaxID=2941333 RepID=UPI00203B8DF5|nr:glycosyltransferase family 2 protein [Mediterraneibacter agrestimuris]
MKPIFSIIVPIYKVEEYLPQCLDSILRQKYKDFEVLLIDDGSPDKCPAICDEYAEKDKRIRVLHKQNEGAVKAREEGLKMAQGEYVGYADGDDWVEDDWLLKVSEVVKAHQPDVITYNTYLDYPKQVEKVELLVTDGFYDKKAMERDIYPIMLYDKNVNFYKFGIYPPVWNKIVKKEILVKNQCTDYRITMGDDAACVYASLLDAKTLFVMKEYFYHYRQNPASMTNAYDENRFEKYQILLTYMDKVLKSSQYNMEEQLKYHKAFRIKHAILNESKAQGSLRKRAAQLKQKLRQYGFEDAFDTIRVEHIDWKSGIFVFLMRHRLYYGLIVMCDVFNMLQKRK